MGTSTGVRFTRALSLRSDCSISSAEQYYLGNVDKGVVSTAPLEFREDDLLLDFYLVGLIAAAGRERDNFEVSSVCAACHRDH